MYTSSLAQGYQRVVFLLKVWWGVSELVRSTFKQTVFGNFFFQEPFEQLPDVFKEKLGSSEKTRLNRMLRKIDMDIFLPQLLQIILLNVKKDGETISTMRWDRQFEMSHSIMHRLNKDQIRFYYLAIRTVGFVTLGINAFSCKCRAMTYKP